MLDYVPDFPRLRAVEAFPIEHEGEQMVLLQDPTGLAEAPLVVSPAGFFILTFFDGKHSLEQVAEAFQARFGAPVSIEQLEEMIDQIDLGNYLDSRRFADYYQELVDTFRAGPARVSREAEAFGADAGRLGPLLDRMLGGPAAEPAFSNGRLVGLVAPHLDYPRGEPCYLAAYRVLAANGPVERAVILGANHFGRGTSVVATGKDFQTPLGLTRTDRAFLAQLERACGADLCEHEFDHVREHSVELQLLILQRLLGAENFEIVPVLCPDPCGPTGTVPSDGEGVDLEAFAKALGRLIAETDKRSVVIAGADLSHFGRRFGDECELDAPFLAEIERKDREALGAVVAGRSDLFLEGIRGRNNDTRICSAGSIYTIMTALSGARAELLRYHQTVDSESGTAVSCSAIALWH
jgi:AmmeMemoRadiSam system protein B